MEAAAAAGVLATIGIILFLVSGNAALLPFVAVFAAILLFGFGISAPRP